MLQLGFPCFLFGYLYFNIDIPAGNIAVAKVIFTQALWRVIKASIQGLSQPSKSLLSLNTYTLVKVSSEIRKAVTIHNSN